MRKLSDFFKKKPEGASQRIELSFLILGGTNAERYNQMVLIRDQHPELKHRFQVDDCVKDVACIFLTNQPLTESQTEEYIYKLAKKQNNIRQLSNPLLALS